MTYHYHDSNLWILTDVAWCRSAPHVGLAPALGLWRTCRGVSAAPAGRARPRGSQEAPEKLPSPEMAKECPSTRSSRDINNRNIQTYSNLHWDQSYKWNLGEIELQIMLVIGNKNIQTSNSSLNGCWVQSIHTKCASYDFHLLIVVHEVVPVTEFICVRIVKEYIYNIYNIYYV